MSEGQKKTTITQDWLADETNASTILRSTMDLMIRVCGDEIVNGYEDEYGWLLKESGDKHRQNIHTLIQDVENILLTWVSDVRALKENAGAKNGESLSVDLGEVKHPSDEEKALVKAGAKSGEVEVLLKLFDVLEGFEDKIAANIDVIISDIKEGIKIQEEELTWKEYFKDFMEQEEIREKHNIDERNVPTIDEAMGLLKKAAGGEQFAHGILLMLSVQEQLEKAFNEFRDALSTAEHGSSTNRKVRALRDGIERLNALERQPGKEYPRDAVVKESKEAIDACFGGVLDADGIRIGSKEMVELIGSFKKWFEGHEKQVAAWRKDVAGMQALENLADMLHDLQWHREQTLGIDNTIRTPGSRS